MNKQEFLAKLQELLCGLPDEDIQKSLDFYSEMIDDRIEDGLLEQEAVAAIGEPQEIAKQILADIPITKLVRQKIKPKRRISALEIVLLILGSPIWLSLIIAVMAVVFAVYVSLWSVIVSLWASFAAFIGGSLGGFMASAILFATGQNIYAAFVMLAAAIFLVGFSILFFFVCKLSTKGMVWLTKKITFFIKSCFLRKERA